MAYCSIPRLPAEEHKKLAEDKTIVGHNPDVNRKDKLT